MATLYRIFSLSSRVCFQRGLRVPEVRVQPAQLLTACQQSSLTPRSFSTLPNILRKKWNQFYLCREKSSPVAGVGMPVSVSALGLLHQARSATTVTQQADTSSDGKSENKKEEKDKWYSGKNAWKVGLLSLTGMGILMSGNLLFVWGAPLYDQEGNEIPDEFSILPKWQGYPKRAVREMFIFRQMIQEPSSQKLLPDPVKEPYYQPPYTLVLELTGVLVHPDWTLNTGWRFKKRPAVDYFMQQIAPPLFEVVIYTREQGFTAFPIIDSLDQHQCVMFRLFRDATRYQQGVHMKDLDCLNRDLSKVIIVDCDPKAVSLQPRNAMNLKKWVGNDDDKTLIDLAAFLRTIASSGIEDVRTVLDHYNQFDDPLEAFKQNQARLQEEQERAKVVADEQKNKQLVGSWGFGLGRKR